MRLSYTHEIIEKRKGVNVRQEMEIVVNYEPDDIEVVEVNIYQDGRKIGEISELLDKAEGDPLCTMLDAIDWDQLYYEKKNDIREYY